MKNFLVALALLTTLPVRLRDVNSTPSRGSSSGKSSSGDDSYKGDSYLAGALGYFPLVGLIVGLALAAAQFVFRAFFPPLVSAVLIVAVWALVTGGLHLDGFSDACDALFASTTRERRLEILHDVHLGAFGATGLALLLIAKTASVASLSVTSALWLAPILGRWAMVYAATYPLARAEGMAAMFRAGLTRREILMATLTVVPAAALGGWFGLGAFVAAFLTAALIARAALARLGGLTGDVYGTICESVELVVLLAGTLTGLR